MTNKEYANGLDHLYNSAKEKLKDFIGLEEPIAEIEREKCNTAEIQKELEKLNYKTEIKYSKKYKTNVLYLVKN